VRSGWDLFWVKVVEGWLWRGVGRGEHFLGGRGYSFQYLGVDTMLTWCELGTKSTKFNFFVDKWCEK